MFLYGRYSTKRKTQKQAGKKSTEYESTTADVSKLAATKPSASGAAGASEEAEQGTSGKQISRRGATNGYPQFLTTNVQFPSVAPSAKTVDLGGTQCVMLERGCTSYLAITDRPGTSPADPYYLGPPSGSTLRRRGSVPRQLANESTYERTNSNHTRLACWLCSPGFGGGCGGSAVVHHISRSLIDLARFPSTT